MASIFQRGKRGTWWIKYYVDGKQVYYSLDTTDARGARRRKREVEGDEAKGSLVAPSKTPLATFLEDYCRFLSTIKTRKSYSCDISVLRIFFGPITPALTPGTCVNKPWRTTSSRRVPDIMRHVHVNAEYLEEVTVAKVEGFITGRIQEDGISPKSANRYREVLHRMFSYAIKNRGFHAVDPRSPNPASLVERRREPARTIRFLTLAQIEEQLRILQDHPTIRAMVATYIYAGLRREEAMWLTKEDVDFERKLIRVCAKTVDGEFWQPKTRKNRVVPISSDLLQVLSAYLPTPDSIWFFPSSRGMRWNPDNFSQDLAEINEKRGLEWGCLDYRHTFGSQLAQRRAA